MLTEVIVEQVEAEPSTQVLIDDSDDDQDEQLQQRVSHGEACRALETLLVYADQEPDISVTTQVLLSSLLVQSSKKRASSLKQKKMSDFFGN